jgi:ribonucleotide monophosphatase NagD (HAD superfamily)
MLSYTEFGKPHGVAYRYVASVLDAQYHSVREGHIHTHRQESVQDLRAQAPQEPALGSAPAQPQARSPLRRIYAVGDNPASDIRGAVLAGPPWYGVLTRSGVFRDGDDSANAHRIVDNVAEAIDFVLTDALE